VNADFCNTQKQLRLFQCKHLFIHRAVNVWNSSASDVESLAQMNTGIFITGHDKAGWFSGSGESMHRRSYEFLEWISNTGERRKTPIPSQFVIWHTEV